MFEKMYRDGFFGRKIRWLGIPVAEVKEQLKKEFELYKDVGMIDKIPDDGISGTSNSVVFAEAIWGCRP